MAIPNTTRSSDRRLRLLVGATLAAAALSACGTSTPSDPTAATEPPATSTTADPVTSTIGRPTLTTVPLEALDRAECERGASTLGVAMQAAFVTTGVYPSSIEETIEAGVLREGTGYEARYRVTGGGDTKPVVEGLPDGPCAGVRYVYEVGPKPGG